MTDLHDQRAFDTLSLLTAAATANDLERQRLHRDAVTLNSYLADDIAQRQARACAVPLDELVHIAQAGLASAIAGFDPCRRQSFLQYIAPIVNAEVARYVRRRERRPRSARRTRHLSHRVAAAAEELSRELHHSPRASQIAARLNVDVDAVVEALATSGRRRGRPRVWQLRG